MACPANPQSLSSARSDRQALANTCSLPPPSPAAGLTYIRLPNKRLLEPPSLSFALLCTGLYRFHQAINCPADTDRNASFGLLPLPARTCLLSRPGNHLFAGQSPLSPLYPDGPRPGEFFCLP